jgi:hypothetical protein
VSFVSFGEGPDDARMFTMFTVVSRHLALRFLMTKSLRPSRDEV